jgi:hypothetical protein
LHTGGKVTQKTAMVRIFRLLCALLAGGQLFFVAIAAQVVFPKAVAELPRGEPRRVLAADLVGSMLARLDAVALVVSALALVLAIAAGRRRLALFPLIVGLCAAASAFWITPQIHALREAGLTGTPKFGMLHGISSSVLLLELILLAIAAWIG